MSETLEYWKERAEAAERRVAELGTEMRQQSTQFMQTRDEWDEARVELAKLRALALK